MSSHEIRADNLASIGAFLNGLARDASLPPLIRRTAARLLREYPTSFTVRYSSVASQTEEPSYFPLIVSAVIEPHWAGDKVNPIFGSAAPLEARTPIRQTVARKRRPRMKSRKD